MFSTPMICVLAGASVLLVLFLAWEHHLRVARRRIVALLRERGGEMSGMEIVDQLGFSTYAALRDMTESGELSRRAEVGGPARRGHLRFYYSLPTVLP